MNKQTTVLKSIFGTLLLVLGGCNNPAIDNKATLQHVDSTSKNIKVNHNDLLWTKQHFIVEMTGADNSFDSIREIANKNQFTATNFDDLIIASAYFERDACGHYSSNISMRNDTLFLNFELTSDAICSALAYYKVDFLINNPTRKKYHIYVVD